MTDNFMKRMEEATNKAILRTQKQDPEYLAKRKQNEVYADIYLSLLFTVIEAYDFEMGLFIIKLIDKDILSLFNAKSINAYVIESEGYGIISLSYENDEGKREGEPEFKMGEPFDIDVLNDILAENNVSIVEKHKDISGLGVESDVITFDASELIAIRKQFTKPKMFKKKDGRK